MNLVAHLRDGSNNIRIHALCRMSTLILIAVLIVIAILILLPTIFHGAVYMPTKHERVKDMVALADVKPGMRVADFGSGDGRIVIAFARAGAKAHGYEIDPLFVVISRWKIRKAGLADRATIHWKSFWSADVRNFDVVTLFGFDTFMEKLERKLRTEMRSGTRVISYVYTFPHWKATKNVGRLSLYEQHS